jgi:hypothetical protein
MEERPRGIDGGLNISIKTYYVMTKIQKNQRTSRERDSHPRSSTARAPLLISRDVAHHVKMIAAVRCYRLMAFVWSSTPREDDSRRPLLPPNGLCLGRGRPGQRPTTGHRQRTSRGRPPPPAPPPGLTSPIAVPLILLS